MITSGKDGLDSKFKAAELGTFMAPVEALIGKPPVGLPGNNEKVLVWPASGSEAATGPASVPLAVFSATEKD